MMRYQAVFFFGIMVTAIISIPEFSFAHERPLALDGCHYERKTGVRHCHRNSSFQAEKECSKKLFKSKTSEMNENDYNKIFCNCVGGKTETRHEYPRSFVKVDCETPNAVYEGVLDKGTSTSLDSLHQAVFYSFLTKKEPVVVIYDRDGELGPYEYRIMKACEKVGVRFLRYQIGLPASPTKQ